MKDCKAEDLSRVELVLKNTRDYLEGVKPRYRTDPDDNKLYCTGCGELKEYGHRDRLCPVYVFEKLLEDVVFQREIKEYKKSKERNAE